MADQSNIIKLLGNLPQRTAPVAPPAGTPDTPWYEPSPPAGGWPSLKDSPPVMGSPIMSAPAGVGQMLLDLLGAAAPEGSGGSALALIPRKGNIKEFTQKVMGMLGANPQTPANMAEAFMKVRYPNRMNTQQRLPGGGSNQQVFVQNPQLTMTPNGPLLGRHRALRIPGDPSSNPIGHIIEYRADPSLKNIHQAGGDVVNTLAHETAHALQSRRVPRWTMDLDKHLPYEDQFFEKQATQAGDTGQRAHDVWLDLVKALTKP